MARKSGGGWFWLILGILAGVAVTLAALLFLKAGPGALRDRHTAADDAAAAAAGQLADPLAPPAPTEPEKKADTVARPADAGIDPSSDDQIAEDAAAAGMTSRPPPPRPDGE